MPLADDDVIEDADINVSQRVLQSRRQHPIGRAALRAARGMVVAEDHRRGVPCQCPLQNDAGIHGRAVDRALKQALECQHAMLSVQKDGREDFVGRRRQLELQILPCGPWMRQAGASLEKTLLQQHDGLSDELFLVIVEGRRKHGWCDIGDDGRKHENLQGMRKEVPSRRAEPSGDVTRSASTFGGRPFASRMRCERGGPRGESRAVALKTVATRACR